LQLDAASEAAGLITGIRWGVPEKLIGDIDAAIALQDWDANVKVGWDPMHVQPTNRRYSSPGKSWQKVGLTRRSS